VLSQVGVLVNNGGFEDEAQERGQRQAAAIGAALLPKAAAHEDVPQAAAPSFVCPETMTCRPKPVQTPGNWNVGLLHHLHSGEMLGPVGVVISILSGIALLFFSFSGLWMYLQMWRNRAAKSLKPGWFWN
jgi:hypothetical protein